MCHSLHCELYSRPFLPSDTGPFVSVKTPAVIEDGQCPLTKFLCGLPATPRPSLCRVLPLLTFISTYLITQFIVIGILAGPRDTQKITNTRHLLVSLWNIVVNTSDVFCGVQQFDISPPECVSGESFGPQNEQCLLSWTLTDWSLFRCVSFQMWNEICRYYFAEHRSSELNAKFLLCPIYVKWKSYLCVCSRFLSFNPKGIKEGNKTERNKRAIQKKIRRKQETSKTKGRKFNV